MGGSKKKSKKKGGGGGGGNKKKTSSNGLSSAPAGRSRNEKDAMEQEEESILSELRTRTRSLLASMKGVAPDGSPFTIPDHPLASLHASVVTLTERLVKIQLRTLVTRREEDVETASTDAAASVATENHKKDAGGSQTKEKKSCRRIQERHRDDPTVWKDFELWLTRCDISPSKRNFPVEIRKTTINGSNSSGGYGLFATRDIPYDETVLEIPVSTMLCPYWDHCLEGTDISSTAPPPPPFDATRDTNDDEPLRPLSLVTYLANERWKGSKSCFVQYLDTLPDSYSTPLFWSLDATRTLSQTSHLKRAVAQQALTMWEYLQMRDAIEERHRRERKVGKSIDGINDDGLIPVAEFTYELFRWSTVTAHTRQNRIPFLVPSSSSSDSRNTEDLVKVEHENFGVEYAFGLVPLWDLLNHEDTNRACKSEVALVPTERGKAEMTTSGGRTGGEDTACVLYNDQRREGMLICRTPPPPTEEGEETAEIGPCFRQGEEVTMYYGERSNAQLLFHSGFVHGCQVLGGEAKEEGAPTTAADWSNDCAKTSDDTPSTENYVWHNRNRRDVALLRLALPPAESDDGLDRVREMIAARFGFRAYVDQGCRHDGMQYAKIAAEIIAEAGGKDGSDVESHATTKMRTAGEKAIATSRDVGSVVMAEFSVSPFEPLPNELERALFLCVADREELNCLLRHMDDYLTPSTKATGNRADDSLKLTEKHVRFVSMLVRDVEIRNRRAREEETSLPSSHPMSNKEGEESLAWIQVTEADHMSRALASCDQITLDAWLKSFISITVQAPP